MKIKSIFTAISLSFVLLLSSVSFAQRGFGIEKQVANLKESLSLNAKQTIKITKILTEFRDDMISQRQNFSGDRTGIMQVMKKMNEVKDLKILKVLTKTQKAKYKKIISERSNRFKNGSRRGNRMRRENRGF